MRYTLGKNHSTETPSYHCCIDTETRPVDVPGCPSRRVNKLFMGVARLFRLERGKQTRVRELVFHDQNTILNWILSALDPRRPLWLWCHNAGFDLTAIGLWQMFDTGELLLERPASPSSAKLVGTAPAKLESGLLVTEDPPTIVRAYDQAGATLWCVDSLNWFLCPLSEMGSAVGLDKLPMPSEIASDKDWESYCRRDVEILESTVVGLMNFVRGADLGNFRATAAGQAWQWFLHSHHNGEMVFDTNPVPKVLQREAYYGGRREVYFNGHIVPKSAAGLELMCAPDDGLPIIARGPVYHLDLTGAYPSVMREERFPCGLISTETDVHVDRLRDRMRSLGAVARVRIDTGVDSYPVRRGDRVIQARGSYDTVLCGPELARAIANGNVKRVYQAQYYSMGRPFITYVDAGMAMRERFISEGKPLYGRLAKLMMNSLHGKFAQRSHKWELILGAVPPNRWGMYTKFDPKSGQYVTRRAIGGWVQEQQPCGESDHNFPIVAAYVSAYCRERMYDLRWKAGYKEVLYEDADSLHVTEEGYNALAKAGEVHPTAMGRLKVVQVADVAAYYGPSDYQLDDRRVIRGIARKAYRDERGMWHQTGFDRLSSTLSDVPPVGPCCTDVVMQQPAPVIQAQVMPDGWTVPLCLRDYTQSPTVIHEPWLKLYEPRARPEGTISIRDGITGE